MSMQPDITICLPCYGRPYRTKRLFDCLIAQTKRNIELLIIGDSCANIMQLGYTFYFHELIKKFEKNGSKVIKHNLNTNSNSIGATPVNYGILIATGKYFCWANNDDIVKPEHADFYFNSIAKTDCDFVYNQSMVNSAEGYALRDPHLSFGQVGHSELVVRTEFLKQMPPHEPVYGQDWKLIEHMMKTGKHQKGKTPFPTYYVASTPRWQEAGFENDI